MTSTGVWTIELGDDHRGDIGFTYKHLDSKTDVFPAVKDVIASERFGRICVDEDIGESSWFTRKILRMNPRVQAMRFAIEWSGDTCSLIFFDDAVSEYRALNASESLEIDEEVRTQISHGQEAPHPLEECLPLKEGLKAVEVYLGAGNRPDWLEYRYVK